MPTNEAAPLVTTPPQKTSANEVLDNRQASQSQRLSNRLTALAEDVKTEAESLAAAERSAAGHALKAGRLLCEAKKVCRHGEWLPFLERAGVHERSAQRWMKLHRSGLKSDIVSDLGGVVRAWSVIKEFGAWTSELASLADEDDTAQERPPISDAAGADRPPRTRQKWAEIIRGSYFNALLSFSETLASQADDDGGAA